MAWPIVILSVALPVPAFFMESDLPTGSSPSEFAVVFGWAIFLLAFAGTGVLLATRLPNNPIGWLFCGAALCWGFGGFSIPYAETALRHDLPLATAAGLVGNLAWGLGSALAITFPFLLFPAGTYLSNRWRWIGRLVVGACVVFVLAVVLRPGPIPDVPIENPLGLGSNEELFDTLNGAALFVVLFASLASVVSLVIRYRRSNREQRQQFKWLLYAGLCVVVGMVVGGLIESLGTQTEASINYTNAFTSAVFALVPVGIAVAVLKYRLYDIDVVISKTIVFGVLAAFITAVYVAIVVGIGAALGSQDEPNLALSIAATAIVAIAFSPVKERTQRLANRLVYGHRLSPYEVLTNLSRAVATAPTPNEVLKAVAHAAALGVNAQGAAVTLDLNDGSHVTRRFPEEGRQQGAVSPETFEVFHESESLGCISVHKSASDPLTPQDGQLLDDLSRQAGLALRNARLVLELQARLGEISAQAEELQSSRLRIVSAADDSRRRLEKDITEGPRREILVLEQGLESAYSAMANDPGAAAPLLESLAKEANTTLDSLRELARGLYPPLLADKGIVPALESHIRKRDLAAIVQADDLVLAARFDEHLENTVYFCCVEILRDGANRDASVQLRLEGDHLSVRLSPCRLGNEQRHRITDRVDASGGTVEVTDDRLRIDFIVRTLEPTA